MMNVYGYDYNDRKYVRKRNENGSYYKFTGISMGIQVN